MKYYCKKFKGEYQRGNDTVSNTIQIVTLIPLDPRKPVQKMTKMFFNKLRKDGEIVEV